MKKNFLRVKKLDDKSIWFYLKTRNQNINVKNSISKKKIKPIDHLKWWFENTNMRSYLVFKDNIKLFILTERFIRFGNKNIILPGLMTCSSKHTIFDLLWSIRWQKKNIDKLNKKSICLISVPKENFFSNIQTKYFDFMPLKKKDRKFNFLRKIFKNSNNFNLYYRLVNE